jgi:hypothetical protein
MRQFSCLVWCAVVVVTGLLAGCEGGSTSEPSATSAKPNQIVVRTKPPANLADLNAKPWIPGDVLQKADLDRIKSVAGVNYLVPMRIFSQDVTHLNTTWYARLVGTTEDYLKFHHVELAAGRFLKDGEDQPDRHDDQGSLKAIVLGARVAESLFPSEDPKNVVGKVVAVIKTYFTVVVGVLKERTPQEFVGGEAEDFNSAVYVPIAACNSAFAPRIVMQGKGERFADGGFYQIIITVADPEQTRSVADAIGALVRKHHEKQHWEIIVR